MNLLPAPPRKANHAGPSWASTLAVMTQTLAAVGLSAIVVAGCAMREPMRLGLKLAPAALGASISLQQHLTVEWQDRIDELDAALEVDAERIDLVGLAFGHRMLALHYDGQTLSVWRDIMAPNQLRGEDVLEDLLLTFWPAEAIQPALPTGWRIEESGLRRTLMAEDVPVMVIEYSGQPRWSGTVKLSNLQYHYRLRIESVSNGP